MRALLSDLDRTLTGADLVLDDLARRRIAELRAAGVRVLIVTGRPLDHLLDMGLQREVDALVAENGAVIVIPQGDILEVPHPRWRARAEAALGPIATSFHWGRSIASGPRKMADDAARLLAAAQVPHTVSFNADEVMLLPGGVDKASGARRALQLLGLETARLWAIGDGENDVPLLRLAHIAGAPSNAHPEALVAADVRLVSAYAPGFVDFTEAILAGEGAEGKGPAGG